MSGNEFFYKDKDGKKQDASLHEPILAAGDEEAVRKIGMEVARRAGVPEDMILKLYAPLDGSPEPDQDKKK
jgi:hypothetical protein